MELDRVSAELRPRDSWEGLDLGFALARQWFWPLWRLWLLTATPVALVCLGIAGLQPDWWMLAVWWLKPLFEVPLLLWVSQRLFGGTATSSSVFEVLRRGWTQLRSPLSKRVLPYLLWRRLSLRRSFLMPVTVLEGLAGPAARQRRSVLNAGGGAASWLTLVCYHFEIILWAGLLFGLYLLVPDELPRLDLAALLGDSESWGYWVTVIAYFLIFSVIAPFYVCGGFAFYLTRRTDIEAWDLELAFRRAQLGSEDGRRSSSRAAQVLPALLLGSALSLLCPSAPGEAAPLNDPDEARALIGEVLKDKAFAEKKEVTSWRPIEREKNSATSDQQSADFVISLMRQLATALKWTLLGAAVVAVAFLLRALLGNWQPDWFQRKVRPAQPEILGAPAPQVTDPPLPSDISNAVCARLEAGDRRGALSLLYRGSILYLENLGLQFPDGATEGECLAVAASRLAQAELDSLRDVIRAWQGLAYAQQMPSPEQILELLARWRTWTGLERGCPT